MYNLRQLMPILNALLVFDEAGRTQNFTRAGINLGMAQPSVSRFITNLEHHLGCVLFERKHNRLELTEQGRVLHRAIVSGLTEIRVACTDAASSNDTPVISIECSHGFSYMWLQSRLQSLMTMLPGFRIRTINSDGLGPDNTSDADLVVKIGDGSWVQEQSVLLFEEEVFPICSPNFIQQQKIDIESVQPANLITLPLIYADCGECGWMGWKDWFKYFNINFRYPINVQPIYNYALVFQAAMEGKGIALAWEQLSEPHLKNNWLVALSNMRVKTGQGYYLCFSKDNPIGELLQQWVNTIQPPPKN